MQRAGIYCRLSIRKGTDEATEAALERQEEDCRRLCEQRGYEVTRIFPDEGFSAYTGGKTRPGFEAALDALASGDIDVLVVFKLDRLTRNMYDLLRIEKVLESSGGSLVSVHDYWADATEPSGRFMMRTFASLAEIESSNTSLRIQAQRRQAAEAGKPNSGRRPYGYTSSKRDEIFEPEAAILREAAERLLRGDSQRSVIRWLNETGPRPSGKPWQYVNLKAALRSPGITSLRIYKGAEYEGDWPAILPREQWRELQRRLSVKHRPGRPAVYFLSGVLACGRCGSFLHSHHTPISRGHRRTYMCYQDRDQRGSCGRIAVSAAPIEELVRRMVIKRLTSQQFRRAVVQQATRVEGEAEQLSSQLAIVDTQLRDLEDMFIAGEVQRPEYNRIKAGLVERRASVHRRIDALPIPEQRVLLDLPRLKEELEDWFEEATVEEQRAVVKALCERIVIGPAVRRSGVFDPGRLDPKKGFGPRWRA
jgi:site-specific DNA recombinase